MPVTWSDEKLILLYCPGRGSNSRPSAHRGFNHEQGVPHPYSLGHFDVKVSPFSDTVNNLDATLDSLPMSSTLSVPLSLNFVVSVPFVISLLLKLLLD